MVVVAGLLIAGAGCDRKALPAPVGEQGVARPQGCKAPAVGPLRASRSYQPGSWEDGVHQFPAATSVAVPAVLTVNAGNAGTRTASLILTGARSSTTCRYRGDATSGAGDRLRSGRRYELVSCTGGEGAGDAVEVTAVRLHLDDGDAAAGDTSVEVSLSCPAERPVFHVAVYMLNHVSTCFVGKPCSGDGCVGLRDDGNRLVEAFTDASFQAVRPAELRRFPGAKTICLELSMTAPERQEIFAELERFRRNMVAWSEAAFDIKLHYFPIEKLELDLARWDAGLWVAPWNMRAQAAAVLDFLPDFNLVVQPIRDAQRRLHHDLGGCGGTFGAEPGLGVAGAGWSWVPKTRSSFFFECAERAVFAHEWLHQVHWALFHLSHWKDRFGDKLSCGMQQTGDPRGWFPDSHQCSRDPDFPRCGQRDCGGNDVVNQHIVTSHWDRNRNLQTNHCRNGVRDFGETGVDTGGDCLPNLRSLPASTVAAKK